MFSFLLEGDMRYLVCLIACICGVLLSSVLPVLAQWRFSDGVLPNTSIQTSDKTLELQCDRIRFAPAGFEDAKDIERKQALSIRFLKNGAEETGTFQAVAANSSIQIVDQYPVEIRFFDQADYDFVLDQIARNAVLDLSMSDQAVSYGFFDLKGSGVAIKALRTACRQSVAKNTPAPSSDGSEAPEGVVYCGGGAVKRQIEYVILREHDGEWDARVTVNGKTIRALTAYSYFGNSAPPKGFVVALLGEDRSEFLIFKDAGHDWLEFGDYTYTKCN